MTVPVSLKGIQLLGGQNCSIYEQLDSGKFGAVATLVFNAMSAKLASLFAHMSQLCQRLNLSMPAQLHRLPFFKH